MNERFEFRDMVIGMTNHARRFIIQTMKKRLRLAWLSTLVLLLVANTALASGDHESARRLSEAGEILPLETILEKAQQHQPGRILEVEFEEYRGQYIYELEILNTNGIVWELRFNAKTGQLLERKQED